MVGAIVGGRFRERSPLHHVEGGVEVPMHLVEAGVEVPPHQVEAGVEVLPHEICQAHLRLASAVSICTTTDSERVVRGEQRG